MFLCKFKLHHIKYNTFCANGLFRAFLCVDFNQSDNAGRNSTASVKLNK